MKHINTKCPAKINLFLKVLDKRIDGYHNIETSFQLIDLYDFMSFEKISNEIIIESDSDFLKDKNNTIYSSVLKVKEFLMDKKYGVKINIKKNIPIGSGMGGASSNAASTIMALNKLWELNLGRNKLSTIAKKVGADVPFFIFGKNALGSGIGEKLKEISSIKNKILIIDPMIHTSSKNMFGLLEKQKKNERSSLYVQNHFWDILIKENKEIKAFIEKFNKDNLINLTGSGSCMFICYKKDEEVAEIIKKIPSKWRLFFCKPLQYSPICYI
tara:strand:+ start:4626 stop:5438 length:813 start_codon:yes stop_codon:yes gene_type:complete